MIIWLIGILGAGKTTLGRKLEKFYKDKGLKTYLLDGDEVRDLFENDLGYTDQDREANIKRIILGTYLLDRNDIIGIICNISPFQHLRDLARRKIEGYNEIYLDKDSVTMLTEIPKDDLCFSEGNSGGLSGFKDVLAKIQKEKFLEKEDGRGE